MAHVKSLLGGPQMVGFVCGQRCVGPLRLSPGTIDASRVRLSIDWHNS